MVYLLTGGTQVPQAVVDGRDDGTVLRMADLGEENRARELGQRVSETDEESTTKVHCQDLSALLKHLSRSITYCRSHW